MASQSSLLGPTPNSAITVGYIDPTLGYVDNISVSYANKYAQLNPGTIFIFFDGDNNLKFLTITEVNSLTYSDLVSKNNKCDQSPKKCGPPIINFFGGGGVGASANPIIGSDGSLLAVDIVSGGFGYKFPPKVSAEDLCQFGSGAVLKSSLGETASILETYTDEEDFEEYVIEEEEGTGIVEWGPDGEVLGEWNADDYDFDNENDPIADEIEKYQKVLIEKPFWSTRKNKPSRITSLDESYTSYDVTHPSWNEFMNKYAISPVPISDFSGSDYSGRIFTFEWIEEFPYDGRYTFNGLCDNVAKVYFDDSLLVDRLNSFNDPVTSFSQNITEGYHVIRVDLLNVPVPQTSSSSISNQISKINPKFVKKGKDFFIEVEGTGTGTVSILVDINDSPIIAGVAAKQIIIPSDDGNVKFTREGSSIEDFDFLIKKEENIKKSARFTGGKTYGPIKIIGASINVIDPKLKSNTKIALYDSDGTDQNIQINIIDVKNEENVLKVNGIQVLQNTSTSTPTSYQIPGIKFVKKNNQYYVEVSGDGEVKAKVKMEVNDSPYIADIAASEIILPTDSGNVSFKRTKLSQIDTFTSSFVSYVKEETIIKNVTFTGGRLYGPIQIIGSSSTQKINGSKKLELYDLDGNDANIKFEIFSINPITSKDPEIIVANSISSASWNTNPIGISMSIDAPLPPIPVEPIKKQIGRCPSNPIWSTRFSAATANWYPVKYEVPNTWSKFMNRYAVSPVLPSSDPGSDQSGITFSNTWNVNIPYDGFYALKGTADNSGKIYVDGIQISTLNGFSTNNPTINKVFLTEGPHTITVEVLNFPQDVFNTIDKKIFSTQDWRSSTQENKESLIDVSFTVYGEGKDSNKMKVSFTSEDKSSTFTINGSYSSGYYRTETIKVKSNTKYNVKFTSSKGNVEQGIIRNQTKSKEGGVQTGNKVFGDRLGSSNDNDDMQITTSNGIFTASNKTEKGGRSTYDLSFSVESQAQPESSLKTIDGVTYSGPPIFAYQNRFWSDNFMNNYSISPKVFTDIAQAENSVIGKYYLTWSNVDFPEDGTYKINFQADNIGTLKIDEQQIITVTNFSGNPIQYIANVTSGKHTITIELENVQSPQDNRKSFIFQNNPMGTALHITKDINVLSANSSSWSRSNPIGVSAVLISPPCPKEVGGRGVVDEVIVEDPGNGYLPPVSYGPSYPVTLELVDVVVENPGINYNCGVDEIKIVPDNGAQLSYICDSFGRINEVNVDVPGTGFTAYPDIFVQSPTQPTGVNASFRPVFRVVRDPIKVAEDKLIQVTDLVGLKQTGYVDGRAYYGAVYYENGIRYAGYYKTTGSQIKVYNTLQESIIAKITTPPSAIEISGTDISSNDSRLNIPRTPETTTEL